MYTCTHALTYTMHTHAHTGTYTHKHARTSARVHTHTHTLLCRSFPCTHWEGILHLQMLKEEWIFIRLRVKSYNYYYNIDTSLLLPTFWSHKHSPSAFLENARVLASISTGKPFLDAKACPPTSYLVVHYLVFVQLRKVAAIPIQPSWSASTPGSTVTGACQSVPRVPLPFCIREHGARFPTHVESQRTRLASSGQRWKEERVSREQTVCALLLQGLGGAVLLTQA